MENNQVILLLGSNIDPEKNIRLALEFLKRSTSVLRKSRIWETEAVGSDGPNFLNMAIEIATDLDPGSVKTQIVQVIEQRLGRVRTQDKYAPRTIDVDIIIFNHQVLDDSLWSKAFVALPVAELAPRLKHPQDQKPLVEVAAQLKSSAYAEPLDQLQNSLD